MNILFASETEKPEFWLPLLKQALPHDRFVDSVEGDIDIALVATPPAGTLEKLQGTKLIQSLWMGVERLLADPAYPRGVPLARLIDPGMVAAMSETVLAHVLDWHRHHYRYRQQKQEGFWRRYKQYLASDRTVGILGMGQLGADAAGKLRALGFNVAGYSRRPRQLPDFETFAGEKGFEEFLRKTDALVCLVPLTAQTTGILNARVFSLLKQYGCVINLARGPHVVVPDLIAALDSGHLAHAYLDVFDTEPLPTESPLWKHPKVGITPHSAALTEPRTAVAKIAENVERVRRGETPHHLVDFEAGY
ncbi:MAG: 2-hydroxyacid dehydrogenase [Betaproteobacteria bacterium]